MKRTASLLSLLTGLAILSGYLLSKASLVGKTGMHFFYKEYRFLKTWYKGAAVLLAVWVFLFLLHGMLHQKLGYAKAKIVHMGAVMIAVAGLYFTYSQFRSDLSYRLLGERFHLGAYLFWIGWVLIGIFHLWPATSKHINNNGTGKINA